MRKPKRDVTQGQTTALPSLSIRRDDFAITAWLEYDPMFWIRLEPSDPEILRLTDLMPGAQDTQVVAEALRTVVPHPNLVRRVILLDVLPDWRSHSTRTVELERRVSATRTIVDAAFRPFNLCINNLEIRERGGKLDVAIDLFVTN